MHHPYLMERLAYERLADLRRETKAKRGGRHWKTRLALWLFKKLEPDLQAVNRKPRARA